MRSLLDLNVLIALLDPIHVNHKAAHAWWQSTSDQRWASCPLTENGFVRILSNPGYGGDPRTPRELSQDLDDFVVISDHEFWSDDISILDPSIFDLRRVLGPGQLTDVYLLALAIKNNGRLITFDTRIPISVVLNAAPGNLCVI